MFKKGYVIFDKTAKEAGEIVLCKNDAVASRMFTQFLNSQVKNGLNPAEYELQCVCVFNIEDCKVYSKEVKFNKKADGSEEKEETLLPYVVAIDLKGDVE